MAFKDRYIKTTSGTDRFGDPRVTEEWQVVPLVRDTLIVIFIFLTLAIYWPLRTVPTGSRGVITVGGAIRGIEGEGFMLLAPWQRLDIFNVRAEQADIQKADGPTIDLQSVTTSMTVRYAIIPERVADVFEKYSHDGNLDSYVETATQEVFKAVTVKYTAPDMISKRAQVSSDIRSALEAKLSLYGARVLNIDMTNFAFSTEYTQAINAKTTQEQLRLGAENKLRTVEAEQKQKVAVAIAEASALKAKADGEAYANLTLATAQADALKVQGNALAQNPSVLELRRIEVELAKAGRWNGALPSTINAGTPIPFFNSAPTK